MAIKTNLEDGHQEFIRLSKDFSVHEAYNLSSDYLEARVRLDFIDPLLEALGWDISHKTQRNPYEQEVLVEKNVSTSHGHKRADYAFHLAPNFRDVQFFVEAKKPSLHLDNDTDALFQTIRYGWERWHRRRAAYGFF